MPKTWRAVFVLGLLASLGPAFAQEPEQAKEDEARDERPVVRRYPPYYQSYYRPGGPWYSSYRGQGYYRLDENGQVQNRPVARGPYFGPHWISGFGAGWDFPPAQDLGRGWTGWGGWVDGWSGGWAGWSVRQRPWVHGERHRDDGGPRTAPRPQ